MGTDRQLEIGSALFASTRRAVLGLLFTHTDEAFYLRELARRAGAGLGAVDREIKRLTSAGIVSRRARGRQVFYQANPRSPAFAELASLMVKTVGLWDVLRAALAPLAGRIRVAFIYGSFARDAHDRASDVDLMIVGDATFAEVVAALSDAQEALGREINPTVYPAAEFHSKLAANSHFLRTVLKAQKTFLIGDQRELRGVASQRLAHTA